MIIMDREEALKELDYLLAQLAVGVEMGDTKAISEHHKILKTKIDLEGLKPITSERFLNELADSLNKILTSFVELVMTDSILPQSSKDRIQEIAKSHADRMRLEELLSQ